MFEKTLTKCQGSCLQAFVENRMLLHDQFEVFSDAQDRIVALRRANTRSAPPLRSLSDVVLETVPVFGELIPDHRG